MLTECASILEPDFDEFEVLDIISALVDKSLVLAEETAAGTRYRLLETILQYGQERSQAAGESDLLRMLHRDAFQALAERAEIELRGASQRAWLDRLELEHDNLRAAMDWSLIKQEANTCIALATSLLRFWVSRGYWNEGKTWLERALSADGDLSALERAKGLLGIGSISLETGSFAPARALVEEALDLFRQTNDSDNIAYCLLKLSEICGRQLDTDHMQMYAEESRSIFEKDSDNRGLAETFIQLSRRALVIRDYSSALAYAEKSLELCRSLNDQANTAEALLPLAYVARNQNEPALATSLLKERLEIVRTLGDKRRIAATLNTIGEIARGEGDYTNAGRLYEEACDILRRIGHNWYLAGVLGNLAFIAQHQGNYQGAKAFWRESFDLREPEQRLLTIPWYLEGLGCVAAAESLPQRAARLFGSAQAIRGTADRPVRGQHPDRQEFEQGMAAICLALDEATFQACWAAGQAMTEAEALAYAFDDRLPKTSGSG